MQSTPNCSGRVLRVAAALLTVALASVAHADIFQWEYINPADPSQGKQQSTMLAPDGAGVDAAPGAYLAGRNLTMAYLTSADLTNANGDYANLTNADLSQANLTHASVWIASLTDANFTGAEVRGTNFDATGCDALFGCFKFGTGLSLDQLYSTASYQANDMSEINLGSNDLTNGNFEGQNLIHANFEGAALTDANFSGATVNGADFGRLYNSAFLLGTGISTAQLYSTASYKVHDLSLTSFRRNELTGSKFANQNLSGCSFTSANLTNADFRNATLDGAYFDNANVSGVDFTDADIHGANFQTFGFTSHQLYSTGSYGGHNLSGINLYGKNVRGWNFAGQKLFSADFGSAVLDGADFTAADARGARFSSSISVATTDNMIWPDGYINGLGLQGGGLLVVSDYRNYFGSPTPFPITVADHLIMAPGGTLRMVFEADAWDSTISFAPGISVTLGGTLELSFAPDVNLGSQVGCTFGLFNWGGVSPTGQFAISSPYAWDLSNLYATGEVTLTAIPEPCTLLLISLIHTPFVAIARVRCTPNSARRENK